MNEETLFELALNTPPEERAALLERMCEGKPELRARVERLLAVHFDKETRKFQTVAPTASFASADPIVGTMVGGKYKLTQLIGEGGMGSVWAAEQTEPVKRRVAVKLIKPGMDSKQVLARFEAERQALAMMDHPNIAKVLDGGVHDGRPFFVMELVKGVPITEFCDSMRLTPRQRLELFVPVCQAIQHAHQKGIIHRDVKPSNVLIALYDDRPVPKAIDFGVAKATGGTLTERTIETAFGGVVGTPQYMSPEQATLNNLDIDTRSDVYSLGILLYELLTGSPPFSRVELERKGLLEMLRVVREEEPPRPSTKLSTADALPSISASRGTEPKMLTGLLRNELDWIVMKALEKDRSRRYETANGFAADVNRYLSGEAVQAHPPSSAYRVKKFVRRNRGQVLAAGLVLLALIAGIIGTTLGLLEARWQTELARAETSAKELARAEEAVQRNRADEFRDKALDALRATTGTDVELLIGGKTELGANEKAYLEAIAKRWQAFAKQEGMDERSRGIRAEGHTRVAMLWQKLGRREDAQAEYEQALVIHEKLATDFSAVPEYRQNLAGNHNDLGKLLEDLGKRAEALEQYNQAFVIREKLAADFPAVPDHRRNLAVSHHNLGHLLADQRKWAEAEGYYDKARVIQKMLTADFPAVPEYRSDLAMSHINLGHLLLGLGKRAEAKEQCSQALAILGKLVTDFPAVPGYRSALAGSHINMGILLGDLGMRSETAEHYENALAIQAKLAADFPAVPGYRRDLAVSHNNLGVLLKDLEKRAEAEGHHTNALAIRAKLAADFPTVPFYRSDLAMSHVNLGALLTDLEKRAEAEDHHSKALAIYEKLAADFPSVPGYRIHVGGSCLNFGILVRGGGRAGESLGWFDKAIAILTPVHLDEPRDVRAKQVLRNSHLERAKSYDHLQKYAEAIKDYDRAIELSSPADRPFIRASRATSRLNAGRFAEAVAEVAELTESPAAGAPGSPTWNAGEWYDFACVYAVAIGKVADKKQAYTDRAMELLRHAVKAGWKDVAHLKKDADLDPLREREDFKKLIAELESKSSPTKNSADDKKPTK